MNEQEFIAIKSLVGGRATASCGERGELQLPDHLVRIPGQNWAFWRTVALRGAGFAASQPCILATPKSAALADTLLQLEDQLIRRRSEALELLRRDLDSVSDSARGLVVDAIRRLKKGELAGPIIAGPIDGCLSSSDHLGKLGSANLLLISAWESFRRQFDGETAEVSDALCGVAKTNRFREAILWQNRRALHSGIDVLLRKHLEGKPRGSKQRQYEEMLASYLQRYCLKNDTIGFFGPVGWAEFAPEAEALEARPGPALLAERNVYFEAWCIDAMAEALAKDKRLEPWLAPWRMQFVHLQNSTLFLPGQAPLELSAREAALLQACDGEKAVEQIARDLASHSVAGFQSEREVLTELCNLRDKGLISLALAVPMELHPEQTLERLLRRIGDPDLREHCIGALNRLRQARDRVASAAGNVEELDQAFENLETTFTHLTDQAATRSAGKTYAARTLVFEDCRRDIEINIGRQIINSLGPPLALLLDSARWLTYDMARKPLAALEQIYDEFAHKTGSRRVSFASFWYRVQPLLFGEKATFGKDSLVDFQRRWVRLLDLPSGERRVEYSSQQLRPLVASAFNAPKPGWPYARYQSPDVMIAARNLDDIRAGEYLLVLGELHVGANTLGSPLFMAQHPCPDHFLRAVDLDLPELRLEPIIPKSFWPGQTARLLPSLISPKDFRMALSPDPSGAQSSKVLPIGSLVIIKGERGLVLQTRDGRLEFDLVNALVPVFTRMMASRFGILPPTAHAPRITFDRLVVSRESWRFSPADVEFAREKNEPQRFVAARRWARDNHLPRYVFVKAPVERKPFYVDFESPVYINILAKAVRRSQEFGPENALLTVSEMLPLADQAWLTDAEGNRYSSEFRMIAVDLVQGYGPGGDRDSKPMSAA